MRISWRYSHEDLIRTAWKQTGLDLIYSPHSTCEGFIVLTQAIWLWSNKHLPVRIEGLCIDVVFFRVVKGISRNTDHCASRNMNSFAYYILIAYSIQPFIQNQSWSVCFHKLLKVTTYMGTGGYILRTSLTKWSKYGKSRSISWQTSP